MTRRIVLWLLALSTVVVTAQEPPRWRSRVATRPRTPGGVPVLVITSPSLLSSIISSTSAIRLQGTAESTSSPLETITWACPTCSPTSGTANLAQDGTWDTGVGGTAPLTVVSDTFTGSPDAALHLLDAEPVGGAWDEQINTVGTNVYLQRRSGGYVTVNSNLATQSSPLIIDTVAPETAIIGTNYDQSVTIKGRSTDGNDGMGMVFAYQNSSNYCSVFWYGSTAATDFYLLKRVAGTLTELDTANVDVAIGDVLLLEVRGTSLSVKQNGVEKLSAIDTFCDDAVLSGIGTGAFRDVTTDDAVTSWQLEDFTLVDQDASSGGITLASGNNAITVTATAADKSVGSDVITVNYQAPDATAPEVTITQPVSEPTQSTGTESITIEGTCTDNTECTSVALACPECTPTTASCTISGSGLNKTFVCAAVTQATGANVLTVTAQDAATNSDTDILTSTLASGGDVTPPSIAITTNSGNNFTVTSASNQTTLAGTASDTSGIQVVTYACTICPPGTATGTTNWSALVTLSEGANVFTVTALDNAGNTNTDTITVTYTPTLTITTQTLPSATVSSAYSQTLQRTGGVSPFTWSNNAAGTTLNDADAQCAGLSISSAGVVSGTPTTAGDCSWTVKVTDNAATTDTQALTITVIAAGAAGPHDYFTDLMARGDCFKGYSFRPQAGQTTAIVTTLDVADCSHTRYVSQLYNGSGSALTETTYCFLGTEPGCSGADTHPQKQDALKVVIPAFRPAAYETTTLAAPMDANDTTLTVNATFGNAIGRGLMVDDEVMVVTAISGTTVTVQRGQYQTTAASHNIGTKVRRSQNSLDAATGSARPIVSMGGATTTTAIWTWDAYFTDSMLDNGLENYKAFQVTDYTDGGQGLEISLRFRPWGHFPDPGFDDTIHVGLISGHGYTAFAPPGSENYPIKPMANDPFRIHPNKWTRFWWLIELNADTDSSKFSNVTDATLAAAMGTANAGDTTVITITYPASTFDQNTNEGHPFTHDFTMETATSPGRAVRIDSEIVTVVARTLTFGTRQITVKRGQYGSTPAAHNVGAQLQVINDYASLYVADEDRDPVLLIDRFPQINRLTGSTASHGNRLGGNRRFWIEFNTSSFELFPERCKPATPGGACTWPDMVAYVRNLAVLKDVSGLVIGDHSSWSSIRVKPVR